MHTNNMHILRKARRKRRLFSYANTSNATANAYRPISRTSFVLKTVEIIVDDLEKSQILHEKLKYKQHSNTKAKSVETALHKESWIAM